jgi:small subunit ribosomal protein S13
MARIAGVNIPDAKQVWVSLTHIYGIGDKTSHDILRAASVEPTVRVKNLTDAEISKIQDVVTANYSIEGDLQRNVTDNIKRLRDINSYRGLRHAANLPARGQRTRTNARTKRGKRITIGGTAKKAPTKT